MTDTTDKLRQVLDEQGLLTGEDARIRSTGWGHTAPCVALAIARPRTTKEVAAVLRICNEANLPVVAQGGLTGLVGGTVPGEGELGLSLERMNQIESVDPVGRTMTVQAGVLLQTIQQRAEEEGLLFPLDLGARGSCQIGGNVATNAGGNRVIRYGMTREMVLGLEVVLADGTVVESMNKMIKNNAGYDLKHLFIGSEGTLGIVTRVVLRLRTRPRSHCAALAALDGFDQVIQLLSAVDEGLGGTLSAFEVMWEDFYNLITTPPAHTRPPIAHGHPYYVLVEALGSDQAHDSERFETVLGECLEQGLIADAAIATSRAERDRLWEMRDDVEQLGRNAPTFTYDVSLAIADMEGYVAEVRAGLRAKWTDPKCVVFGHLGDCNLHVVVSVGDGGPEARKAVSETVYTPLRSRGGSVSAEHGIGTEKRNYLSWSRTEEEIALMRALKHTLDPRGILNPGKLLARSSDAGETESTWSF